MKLRLLAPVLLLAGAAACTTSTGGSGTAAPAPSVPSASPTAAVPPASPSPAATGLGTKVPAPAHALGPSRSDLRDCAGCELRGRRDGVRPGISVALLVRPGTVQKAVFVSYRTASGAVLDQVTVPIGEHFDGGEGPATPPECDVSHHCFVPASVGAHGGTMAAFAVAPSGDLSVTASLTASHPTFTSPDLDGDGVREIVAIQSDCDPACAAGHRFWQVWRLAGSAYLLDGCAPYTESATAPPARLEPALCPR